MTTLFLATSGGHLQQLVFLAPRFDVDGDALWVTDETPQTRSLLRGLPVQFVPPVGVRDGTGVARCLPTARRLRRTRGITRAISTGSGIALGYLPYLSARGVTCHYIESATRVSGPSVTGRVLQTVPGIHRYTQCSRWAGSRWLYRGSVFDGFIAEETPPPPGAGVIRVVVTVGTTDDPFPRLIERVLPLVSADGELAAATGRPVQVLWQTGHTPVDHLPIAATPFLSAAELQAAIVDADIVVSHAGTGTAVAALAAGRLPVLASRRHAQGETVDGHQVELGEDLASRGLAVHRAPDRIVVDDLLMALGRAVVRRSAPPRIELVPA